MSDVIHRLTRKKALPRTGKVLDAVGGVHTPSMEPMQAPPKEEMLRP